MFLKEWISCVGWYTRLAGVGTQRVVDRGDAISTISGCGAAGGCPVGEGDGAADSLVFTGDGATPAAAV
jgi:hypothetical protein